jgi:hypothetical protein
MAQDLELHQSFLKRVKVLVATFSQLANQLLEEEEQEKDSEAATLLAASRTALSTGWISFRSKRHLERTAALADGLRKESQSLGG